MDAHYDSQIKSVAHSNYSGPARQMGFGGGLGAFAVRMGRVAFSLVKKNTFCLRRDKLAKTCLRVPVQKLEMFWQAKRSPIENF